MKISKSKQELARIISENGGWREGAELAAQSKSDREVSFYRDAPFRSGDRWCGEYIQHCDIKNDNLIDNWHQTVLSRAEYSHLYPAPDADGWIEYNGWGSPYSDEVVVEAKWSDGDFTCSDNFGPGCAWIVNDGEPNITHHRLHKPEQLKPEFCESVMRSIPEPDAGVDITVENKTTCHISVTDKPTIEKLAADYRNAKDYAERKQKEADDAKADADARLKSLELAGEDIGLLLSPITEKQEPELVITDWRDLQAGDVILVSGMWWEPDSEYTVDENDGSRDAPIRVGSYWALIGECSFKFIRRP